MSHETEIFWNFHNLVLTPLENAGAAQREKTIVVIREMMRLLAEIVASIEDDAKSIEEELKPSGSASSGGNGVGRTVAPALESWLAQSKRWTIKERAAAREMEILRMLEETTGVVGLKRLHSRMTTLGLSDEEGQQAMVTQLSRLKTKGWIAGQGQGLYSMTATGPDRLQKMCRTHRDKLVPDNVRNAVP